MINLTVAEGSLVIDALNGIRETDGVSRSSHLTSNVLCAINIDALDAKWDTDRVTLMRKLYELSEENAGELLDAVGRFWDASPHVDIEAGLRTAGVLPPLGG